MEAMIFITPKAHWLKNGHQSDQVFSSTLTKRYTHIKSLGMNFEELAEGVFCITDLNTQDTIEHMCKAGLKMNRDFQNNMSPKDTQMVETIMNNLGYGNLIE